MVADEIRRTTGANTMAFKEESKVVLPPWGNGPAPARPLSPKRKRPTASVAPVKPVLKTKTVFSFSGAKPKTIAFGFVVCSLVLVGSWFWMHAQPQGRSMTSGGTVVAPPSIPASVPLEIADVEKILFADSPLSDTEVQNRDVFILGAPMEAHELINYSARATLRKRATEFVNSSAKAALKDGPHLQHVEIETLLTQLVDDDLIPAPSVIMDKLKLGEVGTSWSPPQSSSAAESVGMSVRSDAMSDFEQERPLTYKLQWFVNERPLTYKLQWFLSKDDLLLDEHANQQPYELRWAK